MNRDQVLKLIADVLAGLQVPASLGLELGTARQPWSDLHQAAGFGWHNAEDYRLMIEEALDRG